MVGVGGAGTCEYGKSNATIPLGRSARFAAAIEAHWQAFDLAQEETAHGRQELPAETQPTAAKIEAQSQEAETESHDNPVSPVPPRLLSFGRRWLFI